MIKKTIQNTMARHTLFAFICVFFFNLPILSRPAVHWQERIAVVFIRKDQISEVILKNKIYEKDFLLVNTNGKGNHYRLPMELYNKLDKNTRTLINNPPFAWIEPGVTARRNSENLNVLFDGYKDEIITEKILRLLSIKYPGYTALRVIGKSHLGRNVYALKVSKNPDADEDEPSFFFASALHGNEPLSIDYTLDMARYVLENIATNRDRTALRAVNEGAIWFIPVINPDGVNVFWNKNALEGRKNARDTTAPSGWNSGDGVDLNRNYPFFWNSGHREASSGNPASILYRGPKSASEVEVRNMMALAGAEKFVMGFTFHTFATKILSPYTIEGADNPYPNIAYGIAETLAKKGSSFRKEKDYIADKNLYPVDGTDQDWYFNTLGTYAFTVEGSYQTPDYYTAKKSIKGMLPISREMLEIYYRGPTLKVRTVNPDGRPLEADVSIIEIASTGGEMQRTKKKYGRFDFILPDTDTYTIVAEKKGFKKSMTRIKCKKGVQEVRIVMNPLEQS